MAKGRGSVAATRINGRQLPVALKSLCGSTSRAVPATRLPNAPLRSGGGSAPPRSAPWWTNGRDDALHGQLPLLVCVDGTPGADVLTYINSASKGCSIACK